MKKVIFKEPVGEIRSELRRLGSFHRNSQIKTRDMADVADNVALRVLGASEIMI